MRSLVEFIRSLLGKRPKPRPPFKPCWGGLCKGYGELANGEFCPLCYPHIG